MADCHSIFLLKIWACDHSYSLNIHLNIGNSLLQVEFVQRVACWQNVLFVAIQFVGDLKGGFEPGDLFTVIPIKPYGVRLK